LKIKELSHLLDDYQVEFILSVVEGDKLRLAILPKVLDEKMNEADRTVLQNPFILKGTAEELDEEAPAKIIEWVSKLKEGKDNLVQIQDELDKAAKAKKTPAKKAPAKKKAPPRKTAAEKKAEARDAQAKEAEGQGDLFSSGNRLEKPAEKNLEADIADLGI
jgi:PRTRC genetic system protein E